MKMSLHIWLLIDLLDVSVLEFADDEDEGDEDEGDEFEGDEDVLWSLTSEVLQRGLSCCVLSVGGG